MGRIITGKWLRDCAAETVHGVSLFDCMGSEGGKDIWRVDGFLQRAIGPTTGADILRSDTTKVWIPSSSAAFFTVFQCNDVFFVFMLLNLVCVTL